MKAMQVKSTFLTWLAPVLLVAPAFAQSTDYGGNPSILKRGYTFVAKAPNDPRDKVLTKSDSVELYFRAVEGKPVAEVLQVYMPAPANGMPQIIERSYETNCDAGAVRFKSMSTYDAQWKRDGTPREMAGSKWELPAENSFAYFALRLSCNAARSP